MFEVAVLTWLIDVDLIATDNAGDVLIFDGNTLVMVGSEINIY